MKAKLATLALCTSAFIAAGCSTSPPMAVSAATPTKVWRIGVTDTGLPSGPRYDDIYTTAQFNALFTSVSWTMQQRKLYQKYCGVDDPALAAKNVKQILGGTGGPHGWTVIQFRCG